MGYKKVSYDLVCEYCGKKVTSHDKRKRYCSRKCKDIALRLKKGIPCNPNAEPFKKVCAVCGKPFETFREASKTCSSECANRYHTGNVLQPCDPRMCMVCGAIFIPHDARQITCGSKCRKKYHNDRWNAKRKAKRATMPPPPPPEPVECVCEKCGKTFPSDPRWKKKYCSDECRKKSVNKRHDKRIPKEQKIDNINVKKLFKRDSGKCYLCGGDCDWNDWRTSKNGNQYPGDTYPTIDHILPVSKGGYDSWDNVKLACWKCNIAKADAIVDDDGMTMEFAYSQKGRPTTAKKTAQYSLDGELIRIWDSTAQIRRELGLNDTHIQSVCRGDKSNTGNAYGFHWEYIEEQNDRVC